LVEQTSYLVDASVMAKWFNRGETNEQEAIALRDAWSTGKIALFSPALILFEVANSIWKNPNTEPREARSLVRLAVRLVPNFMEINEDISEEAMALAKRGKLTFYDSIYVALSKFSKLPLISADSDQLEIARGYAKSLHIGKVGEILT